MAPTNAATASPDKPRGTDQEGEANEGTTTMVETTAQDLFPPSAVPHRFSTHTLTPVWQTEQRQGRISILI